jgi:osmotically-inducible protein OsmY
MIGRGNEAMVFKAATFHGIEPEIETEHHTRAVLEAAVANALAVAGGIDACDVEVRAKGQEITLDGMVATPGEIERASIVAKTVEGVRLVRNRIVTM